MKTSLFLILLSVHSSVCFGENLDDHLKELNSVRAEREANLKMIVAQFEIGLRDGTSGVRELLEAKIDLHGHEREGESSARKKIVPQQKILKLEEHRHSIMARMRRNGDVSSLEFLKSRERLLAAKQLLLEFKVRAISNRAAEAGKE